ncbi:hypothetical protein EBT11_05260 [bacterium]|nr:hypothetical protein [bacterium]
MHGTEGVAANFEFSNFGRQVGREWGWTPGGGGIQSGEVQRKLMSQAELMAWEVKARRWLVLGLVGVVTVVFGVGWMTLNISYSMLKKSDVMRVAVERVLGNERVRRELGEPVTVGWSVTGELEDKPQGGTARLEFHLRGSIRGAKVTLRAERGSEGGWKYLLLEVKVPGREPISCADGTAVAGKKI